MTSSEVPLLEETEEILAARRKWQFTGRTRPPFAESSGKHQESVWDYPRPPIIEPVEVLLEVLYKGQIIASSSTGKRVLETAGAPTYYFPPGDVSIDMLRIGSNVSLCEWKGLAETLRIDNSDGTDSDGTDGIDIGWRYTSMFPGYEELHLWVSFYPAAANCYRDGKLVTPQPGGYYGGWVTRDITGPIKGGPGSEQW